MILSSNWTASDGFSLNDGVELCTEVPTQLPDLLLENKSFVLLPDEQHHSLPCSLTLQSALCAKNVGLGPVQVMTSITLVSEARLVEVFVGDHEEYFKSFSGQVLQSFPDSIVCRTDIYLLKPRKKVKLLLRNLFDAASVMVYGVFAKVEELSSDSSDSSSFSKFSSSHLNSLLADRSLNLSENALALKRILEQYNDNVDNNAAATLFGNVMTFLSMNMARAMIPNKSAPPPAVATATHVKVQDDIEGSPAACSDEHCPNPSVKSLRENDNYVTKENDLPKSYSDVKNSKVCNDNSVACEHFNEVQEATPGAMNVEFLSNALKNQLNLNLNNSISPESAQVLNNFLEENSSNFTCDQQSNRLSEVKPVVMNLARPLDCASPGHATVPAFSVLCATNLGSTERSGQSSESESDMTLLLNAGTHGAKGVVNARECHTQTMTCVPSADEPSVNGSSKEKLSHQDTIKNTLSVNGSSKEKPSHQDTIKNTLSVNGPSKEEPSVESRSECVAGAPPVQSSPSISCESHCACHQLEKIIDDKLEKFESRIESLIDRKLNECVSQILNNLSSYGPEKLSLGRL